MCGGDAPETTMLSGDGEKTTGRNRGMTDSTVLETDEQI
jgi:hypothetical protein